MTKITDGKSAFAARKKTKQIGFLTAMVLSMGTVVGAGIFFKNWTVFTNNWSSTETDAANIAFSVVSWLVAIFGVLAIAVALIEMNSASKDDKGILTYARNFTKPYLSKIMSVYWYFFFIPINIVSLSFYVIKSFQDAANAAGTPIVLSGYVIALICLVIFLWLAIVSYFSIKASGYLQWVFTICGNLVPLILVPIFGFIIFGNRGSLPNYDITNSGIASYTRFFGIGLAIPSIMFSFDGFYTITSLRSDMKEPKKISSVMIIALVIVSFLYFLITIAMIIASTQGSVVSMGINNLFGNGANVFVLSLIGVSVLSTLNGYSISVTPQLRESHREKDVWFVWIIMYFIKHWLRIKDLKQMSFVAYFMIILFWYILIVPIGLEAFRYSIDADTLVQQNLIYGTNVTYLYSFIDVTSTFTSIIAYSIIGAAIIGGLVNRKKHFIVTTPSKWFVPAGTIAAIFTMGTGILYIVGNFANWIIFGTQWANDPSQSADFIKVTVGFGIFIFTLIAPNLIVLFEMWYTKYKGDPFAKSEVVAHHHDEVVEQHHQHRVQQK